MPSKASAPAAAPAADVAALRKKLDAPPPEAAIAGPGAYAGGGAVCHGPEGAGAEAGGGGGAPPAGREACEPNKLPKKLVEPEVGCDCALASFCCRSAI